MNKKTVLFLFGGESPEHEVSLSSAKNVYDAIDKEKYDLQLVSISKEGVWRRVDGVREANEQDEVAVVSLEKKSFLFGTVEVKPDVILPILHGENGEDGVIQALAKLLHIPIAGPSLESAVITMDKDVTKNLLSVADIPVVDWIVIRQSLISPSYEEVVEQLGSSVLFVKPSGTGSSVGVSKVSDKDTFEKALETAFSFDRKVIVEAAVEKAREIEVAVLGNQNPEATLPGEIIPGEEFYSYDDKYSDSSEATVKVPAELPDNRIIEIQRLAIEAYKAVEGWGMARVDFFLTEEGKLYVNELNSIPGFTNISMYPKLWENSGLTYSELIDKLLLLALDT